MTSTKPLAVFALSHPWMQEMVLKAAPPEFKVRFVDPNNQEAIQTQLPQADFLVTIYLPANWVPLLKRCKLVQHQGVGYDGIDAKALAEVGIPLALTPDGTVIGVAEHSILLILALYKQVVQVHQSMKAGKFQSIDWRAGSHFFYKKTLGIVGLGRIGQRVAHLAKAFDARLIYYDVFRPAEAVEKAVGISFMPFDELLPQADVISVHTPLTPETEGLFGTDEFARMKSGAMFINTSRTRTYDMDALYQALKSGHLGAAGLDVFTPEPPPPDHPILQLPNLICTPHMATGTVEAHLMKARAQFENFRRILSGKTPHNLVTV